MVRYTAGSRTAVNENGAVDRAVTDHGDLTVKLTADTLRLQMNHVCTKRNFGTEKEFRNRWAENFPDENAYRRRQGYLPKLVTKMCEMPTTFVSLVVKRNCSDGQRDRPLYGNFAQRIVSGI